MHSGLDVRNDLNLIGTKLENLMVDGNPIDSRLMLHILLDLTWSIGWLTEVVYSLVDVRGEE